MMACFNSILQWLAQWVAPIQLNCVHKIYCGNLVGFLVSFTFFFPFFFGLGKMTRKDRNYFVFILSRNEFYSNVWAVFVVFLFIFPYILWDVSYSYNVYECFDCHQIFPLLKIWADQVYVGYGPSSKIGEVLYGVMIYTENVVHLS